LARIFASDLLVVAGGEMGLSSAEAAALASAGFLPVRLGPYVLRAVTAAVAASALLTAYRDDRARAKIAESSS
jgi:16S rRNA (uracil1498-N3)-methyltransferase